MQFFQVKGQNIKFTFKFISIIIQNTSKDTIFAFKARLLRPLMPQIGMVLTFSFYI